MNPNPNLPVTLSSRWKPREPSNALRTRLLGRQSDLRGYSIAIFLRWLVPATACLIALCVSIVHFNAGRDQTAPLAIAQTNDKQNILADYLGGRLADSPAPQSRGNNRLAQISGSILEWTKQAPSNSTKGFLLQTFTNSSMF